MQFQYNLASLVYVVRAVKPNGNSSNGKYGRCN